MDHAGRESEQIWASTISPFLHTQLHSFVLLNVIRLLSTPLPNPHTRTGTLHPVDGLFQTMEPVQASKPSIYITIDVPMPGRRKGKKEFVRKCAI